MRKSHDDWQLILASASPRRLALLEQLSLTVNQIFAPDIDETPERGEQPYRFVQRMAKAKALAALSYLTLDREKASIIVAADTVVAVGRRILPKAELSEDAEICLKFLSGRNHKVYTAVSIVAPSAKIFCRVAIARVRFKRLSKAEIKAYIASGQWHGKAGGYGIQGLAGAFVKSCIGSPSTIIGLPLCETFRLLCSLGYPGLAAWSEPIEVI